MSTPQTPIRLAAHDTTHIGAGVTLESPVAASQRSGRPIFRSMVFGVAAAAAASTLSFALTPSTASAMPTVVPAVLPTNAMPTNSMAPAVTASAHQALDSFRTWMTTGDAAHGQAYDWYRSVTARHAATELGYPTEAMVDAWAAAPAPHQLAVLVAMTQLGVPYQYGMSAPGVGFDCSGITQFAWANAAVPLAHQSSAQINAAAPIDRASAKAGDLVQYPGHVMMYLGVGDAIIHARQTGRTVELGTISPGRSSSVRFGDPTY